MFDLRRCLDVSVYGDRLGITQMLVRGLRYPIRHRCREERRLPFLGRCRQDRLDILREPTIQHFIGLVQDEHAEIS